MKIAVVDQGLQIESDWCRSFHYRVLKESCVFAVPHPKALFDDRVPELISPNGDLPVKLKFQYRPIALRHNCSARPTMNGERVCRSIDCGELVEAAYEKSSSGRSIQGSDK